jgi:hypothetical protein
MKIELSINQSINQSTRDIVPFSHIIEVRERNDKPGRDCNHSSNHSMLEDPVNSVMGIGR